MLAAFALRRRRRRRSQPPLQAHASFDSATVQFGSPIRARVSVVADPTVRAGSVRVTDDRRAVHVGVAAARQARRQRDRGDSDRHVHHRTLCRGRRRCRAEARSGARDRGPRERPHRPDRSPLAVADRARTCHRCRSQPDATAVQGIARSACADLPHGAGHACPAARRRRDRPGSRGRRAAGRPGQALVTAAKPRRPGRTSSSVRSASPVRRRRGRPPTGAARPACSPACSTSAARGSRAARASSPGRSRSRSPRRWSRSSATLSGSARNERRARGRHADDAGGSRWPTLRRSAARRGARLPFGCCSRSSCIAAVGAIALLARHPHTHDDRPAARGRHGRSCSTSPRASRPTRSRASAGRSPRSRAAASASGSSSSPTRRTRRCRRGRRRPISRRSSGYFTLPPQKRRASRRRFPTNPWGATFTRRHQDLGRPRPRALDRGREKAPGDRRARERPRRRSR